MNNEIAAYNFPAVLNKQAQKEKKNPQRHQVYIVEVIADDNPSVTPNLTLLYIRECRCSLENDPSSSPNHEILKRGALFCFTIRSISISICRGSFSSNSWDITQQIYISDLEGKL